MAWVAGAFTRVGGTTHWVDDKNAAINIVASRHDTNDEDLATGINFCLNKDGSSAPTGDFTPAVDNTKGLGTAGLRWATLTTASFKATATQINAFGPTAAAFLDITPDSLTFTITMTGCTGAITATASWFRIGKLAFLTVPSMSGVSNATTLTWTGIPAAIQSASITNIVPLAACTNGGASVNTVDAFIGPGSGTLTARIAGGAAGWNPAGAKGTAGFTIPLLLT